MAFGGRIVNWREAAKGGLAQSRQGRKEKQTQLGGATVRFPVFSIAYATMQNQSQFSRCALDCASRARSRALQGLETPKSPSGSEQHRKLHGMHKLVGNTSAGQRRSASLADGPGGVSPVRTCRPGFFRPPVSLSRIFIRFGNGLNGPTDTISILMRGLRIVLLGIRIPWVFRRHHLPQQ